MKGNLISFLRCMFHSFLIALCPKRLITLLPNSPLRRRTGQMAIVMVLVTLMFLLIMIPVIEMFVKNEAKWSVKEKKSTLAFHLAEAAVDRGYWKLIENSDNWDTIAGGGTISGYANDKEYTDIEGGSYKIDISSGDNAREIVIIGTGKDFSSNEYRAIKVVYEKTGVQAAIYSGDDLDVSGSVEVHWGPIMSKDQIEISGDSNQLYPRKFSRADITAGGTYPDRDGDPNPPNKGPQSDPYIEWWSYNEPPGVPDIDPPDLSYYRDLAIDQGYYYPDDKSISDLVDSTCAVGSNPKVRFVEDDAKFTGKKYFCGVLIVLGDLTFTGSGKNPEGAITATPPAEAWQEYQLNVPIRAGETESGDMSTWDFSGPPGPYGDTSAVDEYPGDAGYHTVSDFNFVSGRVASGDLGGVQSRPLSFKGYIYVGEDFDATGSVRIYGTVQAPNDDVDLSGSVEVFYDSSLEIEGIESSITKVSWYEVTPVEF